MKRRYSGHKLLLISSCNLKETVVLKKKWFVLFNVEFLNKIHFMCLHAHSVMQDGISLFSELDNLKGFRFLCCIQYYSVCLLPLTELSHLCRDIESEQIIFDLYI